MTPAEVLLFSQILSLVTQAVQEAIQTRKKIADNASATEQANIDSAIANFQKILDSANAFYTPKA